MSEYLGYNQISFYIDSIEAQIPCKIIGNKNTIITGFGLSNRSLYGKSYITYCNSENYLEQALVNDKIKAILLSYELLQSIPEKYLEEKSFVIVDYPETRFYELFNHTKFPYSDKPQTGLDAEIGSNTIIEEGVIIGNNVKIGHNSVIRYGTVIGNDVLIGSNVVIGGDGFQMIKDTNGKYMTIPHRGGVKIGNNVFIGDGTTIAKSLFDGYTEIGDDTKISNQVAISHNCRIGRNCAIAANATLFGSCEIKDNVWIAPASSILNRVVVEENAFICAHSFVSRNVPVGDKVFGIPAVSRYRNSK